jgi:hypothetical protein
MLDDAAETQESLSDDQQRLPCEEWSAKLDEGSRRAIGSLEDFAPTERRWWPNW